MKFKFFIFVFLFSEISFSFPEMVRHNYVNCGACHVATAGGGVLNAYGRTISHDLLSTWGNPEEARAFYSVDPKKVGSWLNLGGDGRVLQVHQENENLKRGRFFWMQSQVDVSVNAKDVTAVMSIGQVNTVNESWRPISTKYFAAYQFSDEFSLRAGRYIPLFGLNIPQHQSLIKQNLMIGPGTERDGADLQWNGEVWNFALGYSKSLLTSMVGDEEKALHAVVQTTFNDSSKLGFSYWSGDANTYKKTMYGVNTVLGWSEKLYTLAEVDQVSVQDKTTDIETKSIYQFLKTGYEFYKGVHVQVVQEWGKPDTNVSGVEVQSLGAGFIWYPRPHFEFESLWSKRRTLGVTDKFEDYAYLLGHFYF